ncbi:uncharacterized protein EAF01_002284 [Botrytis porri]|uniref:Uncharacterized protein n=1 Tax=Botrytis porri TaxID=87229 RepID=A0A4Z1KNI6_9HELO|nr:uncharacterized protein EAF01_002284 [Botrytis porri]KAF7910775.1 hypothetical protein EAF01_002284 [Botrytis porri]TGO87060.1 hypothetical protein BPOR_0253g00010 [Botrytis porri]
MMCPKNYDNLLREEDYFRSQYRIIISLKLTDAPDTIHYTDLNIHTAIMSVHGSLSLFANAPEFRSDENGAFYRQNDAIVNARFKLVEWFKDMEAKDLLQ